MTDESGTADKRTDGKKDENAKTDKKQEWKNALTEGLMEILFVLGSVGIGFVIALLLPYETAKSIPFEILAIIGCVILVSLFLVGFLAVRLIKNRRKRIKRKRPTENGENRSLFDNKR